MTGCGCLLLVAVLAGLLYVLVAGSTDPGEPIEQAVAVVVPFLLAAQAARSIGTRRGSQAAARS